MPDTSIQYFTVGHKVNDLLLKITESVYGF